jgi:hypothetical protein
MTDKQWQQTSGMDMSVAKSNKCILTMYWRVSMLGFQDCHVSGYRLCRVVDAGQILGGVMTGLKSWHGSPCYPGYQIFRPVVRYASRVLAIVLTNCIEFDQ